MSQRILITGVSRGLGRAMAEKLIALGHTVCGCARNQQAIDELARRYPAPHRFAVVDVVDDAAVQAWASQLDAAGQPFDLVLNNAAVANKPAPLWEVPAEEFRAVIEVNILGVANVIRHFVPPMIARGQGVIVNFSSGWGRTASPDVAPYCATKYAIEGLTQALAQELPPEMIAVPLSPGVIDTDMLQLVFGREASSYPDPQSWAEHAVPFILSLGPAESGNSLTVPA